jgi:hypothetical protein
VTISFICYFYFFNSFAKTKTGNENIIIFVYCDNFNSILELFFHSDLVNISLSPSEVRMKTTIPISQLQLLSLSPSYMRNNIPPPAHVLWKISIPSLSFCSGSQSITRTSNRYKIEAHIYMSLYITKHTHPYIDFPRERVRESRGLLSILPFLSMRFRIELVSPGTCLCCTIALTSFGCGYFILLFLAQYSWFGAF